MCFLYNVTKLPSVGLQTLHPTAAEVSMTISVYFRSHGVIASVWIAASSIVENQYHNVM